MPIVTSSQDWSDESVAGGSTMAEAPRHSSDEIRFEEGARAKARKLAQQPAKKIIESRRLESADKVRAGLVFGTMALELLIGLWALSQVDRWFGGGTVPPPQTIPAPSAPIVPAPGGAGAPPFSNPSAAQDSQDRGTAGQTPTSRPPMSDVPLAPPG
jgi:hypothetical protein